MGEARSEFLARRKLLTGALVFAVLPTFVSSRARAAGAFDGSWGGLDPNGETVQIIFVDGQIIGFYWRGDYLDVGATKLDGANLSFSFKGGQAFVTRNGGTMTVVIRDKGGESRAELKKD
jgi:hypothetical protein